MAAAASSTMIDELLVSICSPNPPNRRLKESFGRKVRAQIYPRTSQFEVRERLDGLQEKCQILNHDELADALHKSLNEASAIELKWIPEVLDLLLRLSDDPVSHTRVEDLAGLKHETTVPLALAWQEVEEVDSIDGSDLIWASQNLSDLSSDDEIDLATDLYSNLSTVTETDKIDASSCLRAAVNATEKLSDFAVWNDVDSHGLRISEIQAIRECLFVLQGLRSTIFVRDGAHIEIDTRFRVEHTGVTVFHTLMTEVRDLTLEIDVIRCYTKTAQSLDFLQAIQDRVLHILFVFDSTLLQIERHHLSPTQPNTTSLLSILHDVRTAADDIVCLSSTIRKCQVNENSMIWLDVLQDEIDHLQSFNQSSQVKILLNCFDAGFSRYWRTVRSWIQTGELPGQEFPFFVKKLKHDGDKSRLWTSWFDIDRSSLIPAPRCLHTKMAMILNTGKTAVFLWALGDSIEKLSFPTSMNSLENLIDTLSLVPLSYALDLQIETEIEAVQSELMKRLHQSLDQHCGLRITLKALADVYFKQSGLQHDIVDLKLYGRIDRRRTDWHDQYYVTHLFHEAFARSESVSTDELYARVNCTPRKNMQISRKSVKILVDLSLDYRISWPLANIISKQSIAAYQRVYVLLSQIRRAIYVLERRMPIENLTQLGGTVKDVRAAQRVRHALLTLTKTLYSHITGFVVSRAKATLLQTLENISDLDSMIIAHKKYLDEIEARALTLKRLSPIRDSIVNILDLCIQLSDLTAAVRSDTSSEIDASSFISAASTQRYRRNRHAQPAGSSSDESESDDGEGYSTFILAESATITGELKNIESQFGRHVRFVIAGLESAGRAAENGFDWQLLAQKLSWRGRY